MSEAVLNIAAKCCSHHTAGESQGLHYKALLGNFSPRWRHLFEHEAHDLNICNPCSNQQARLTFLALLATMLNRTFLPKNVKAIWIGLNHFEKG